MPGEAMTDDVPLICDPVPCNRITPGVLICDRMLSRPEVERVRAEVELAWERGAWILTLPEGWRFVAAWDEPQWPDAEFCAA